jgi:glycosyltransferase involved in cell wall biosynthesis
LSIAVCRLRRVPFYWICHNVDRESKVYFPAVSRLRRSLVALLARRIIVVDPGLVPSARQAFPNRRHKIDYVTFGRPPKQPITEETAPLVEQIRAFVSAKREEALRSGLQPQVLSAIGVVGEKYLHFRLCIPLLSALRTLGIKGIVIAIGPFSRRPGTPCYGLDSHPDVFFVDRYTPIDEDAFPDSVDLLWRGYRDHSMSFTLYKAALIEKPVLATRTGFVGEAVDRYGLGATVSPDFSDLDSALERIRSYDPSRARSFLGERTWEAAARRFLAITDN